MWPRFNLKTTKMSKKHIFGKKLQESMGKLVWCLFYFDHVTSKKYNKAVLYTCVLHCNALTRKQLEEQLNT